MGVDVIGLLPYSRTPVDAMLNEKTVLEFTDDDFTSVVRSIWDNLHDRLVSSAETVDITLKSSLM